MWLAWSVTYQYYILILWRGGLCMAKRNNFQKKQTRTNLAGFLFASPWIIGFIIFGLYPIVMSMYYSLCKFNVFQPPQWIGLQNYKELFTDELFYKSLANTLYMTVVGTPLNLIVGLMTALLLNMKVKGKSIYRTIFYLPSIVPVVASSLLWLWILNPQYGLLNQMLGFLSLPQPNWLSDPAMTKPSLIIMGLWGTGGIMIIFLAALQDVPRSLYEAAEIDGASTWRKFINITLPSISPVIFFQLIMGLINNFQYFTQAYIIAGAGEGLNAVSGGPRNSLLFYALYLFQNAFGYFKMGKASAMAWILFVIVALVTWLVNKTSDKWVTYGGE